MIEDKKDGDSKGGSGGFASPRKAGPAKMQKVGKAGPGGGKPLGKTTGGNNPTNVSPGKVVKIGKPAMTKAPSAGPTTTSTKTGTVKKK